MNNVIGLGKKNKGTKIFLAEKRNVMPPKRSSQKNSSKKQELDKRFYGSWGKVRGNVKYEGCFGDAAYFDRSLEADRYYNLKGDPQWEFKGDLPADPNIPRHGQRRFPHLLDGPARIIPSIEKITSSTLNPVNLPLHQALRRCYEMAKKKGKRYFALTGGGFCLATHEDRFKVWGELNPKECKTCLKPCGQSCQHKRRKCHKKVHQTCAHDDEHQQNKGYKAGGYFTNSVYSIKDMEFKPEQEDEDSKEPLPDVEEIVDQWAEFRYRAPKPDQGMQCELPDSGFFDLSKTQLFALAYMVPDNPIKGMAFVQSAGSGKTALSTNVMGNFMELGWEMLWVTRKSLDYVPLDEIYKNQALLKIRRIINSKEPLVDTGGSVVIDDEGNPVDTVKRKIAFIKTQRGRQRLTYEPYNIQFYNYRILPYDDFVKLALSPKSEVAGKLLRGSPNGDPLYKTLVIVDEAHNLISDALPLEERKLLSQRFPQADVWGDKYKTVQDVYGPEVYAHEPNRPLEGRDLIAALLYRSYRLSAENSAKILLLSATPMSTSPTDLFWLMNLFLPDPTQRLSMNLAQYYDPATKVLNDFMVVRFAHAAHGRLSFFNSTQDPTKFAVKIFYDKFTVQLHKFHTEHIEAAIEQAKQEKASPQELVAIYRNMSLAAKTRGAVYSEKVIAQFKRNLQRVEKGWNIEEERERQTQYYYQHVEEAAQVFKLDIRAADIKKYEKLKAAYENWRPQLEAYHAKQRQAQQKGPPVPAHLADFVDINGTPLTVDEWLAKDTAVRVKVTVREEDSQAYEKLTKKLEQFAARVKEYEQGKRKSKPRKPQLEGLFRTDGTVKDLSEFAADKQGLAKAKRSSKLYSDLLQEYAEFQDELQQWKRGSWVGPGKKPHAPAEVLELLGEQGEVLSQSEWYRLRLGKTRYKAPKKKYTSKEEAFLAFLIQDPDSGKMRLRTLSEYLDLEPPDLTLDGPEERKNVTFLMWHQKFNPSLVRELAPFYMPKLYECVQNIIRMEQDFQEKFQHGFKHTVFTFSVGSARGEWVNYGTRIVASVFRAFEDHFHLCLSYKKDKQTGKTYLDTSKVPKGKWGVALLSSRPIPSVDNIYGKQEGNQAIEFNPTIKSATQEAFNQAANRFGEQIKVIILDGAFMEGVSTADPAVAHMLNPGLSREQLEQASARSARNCKSTNIPFYKGVGGFLEMYFYEDHLYQREETLYQQMLASVPEEELLRINLIERFTDLAAQFSVDYWLNYQMNEYTTRLKGRIVDYYPKYNMIYVVEKELHWSLPGDRQGSSQYRFLVDLPDMERGNRFQKGDTVRDVQGRAGHIVDLTTAGLYQVQFPSELVELPYTELRHPLGKEVEFDLPYGVKLAQKIMNIGNYTKFQEENVEPTMIKDLKVPENAMDAIYTGFRGNTQNRILGLIALFKMLILSGGSEVPVHVVLPPQQEWTNAPNNSSYALSWSCGSNNKRQLYYRPEVLQEFLAPQEGISMLFLDLSDMRCGFEGKIGHANLLIYIPAWGTVERFDPMGYRPHWYDSVALDARLYDLFQTENPALRYMSTAETNPHRGLQFWQSRENKRHKLDPQGFCAAFTLFYMHMRLLYAMKMLKEYPKEKRIVYPIQFQRGLIHQFTTFMDGDLTVYIRTYAENVKHARDWIKAWEQYDLDLPFWSNAVSFLHLLRGELARGHKAYRYIISQKKLSLKDLKKSMDSEFGTMVPLPIPSVSQKQRVSLFDKFKKMVTFMF